MRLAFHQVGQAAHALDDVVVGGHARIGAVLAKAMQACVDQARIALAQRVGVQAQRGQFCEVVVVVGLDDDPLRPLGPGEAANSGEYHKGA